MSVSQRNTIANYISDVILGTYFQQAIWIVYQMTFLTFEQVAFYAGLATIIEMLMQMPTGAFADLYGRRISLALGNLFMALPMFLIAFFPRAEVMLAYAVMWGLGRALSAGTNKSLLYESLESEGKTENFAKLAARSSLFFQISAAISIAVGGYLFMISRNLPYIVSGTASLIGFFTSFLFVETLEQNKTFHVKTFVKTNVKGFLEIFKNDYVAKFTILFSLTLGIANVNQQFFIQPYMVELGLTDIQRSWIATIIKIIISIVGTVLASNKKFMKKHGMLALIPVVMAIALIPAQVLPLPWIFLVIIGVAFASGNTQNFMSPEYNKHLRSELRSTALSAQKMLSSFVGAIIQWSTAFLVASNGVGTYFTYIGIFVLVLLVPLALLVINDKRKNENNLG